MQQWLCGGCGAPHDEGGDHRLLPGAEQAAPAAVLVGTSMLLIRLTPAVSLAYEMLS
jgi:hypothetical protein